MLIVALLMAMTIMAQKTAVSGTVVDASTGEPVMGASVTAGGLSVVTNADGFFTLKSEQATEAVGGGDRRAADRQHRADGNTAERGLGDGRQPARTGAGGYCEDTA